ncbi:BlaI/MecI/CopY family transcriptional regulator [Brevibacterium sp. FAM 25378]|uniref:BlaI/MecI/CopY family transcriptional regulator n=1 Tax=unclassified Brevibacterium TaxID=2614124 RepID=UPI001091D1F5|nr:BlaI/MecI/CopY family transcriptional regulator [Brevibacterium sp. S22]TGD29165.1 BlaI/MecI/CopY family transcriptional regulator [Brevibacterium sp. S22]
MTHTDEQGGASSPIRLGALEKQVMGMLWDHGPLTVRQIIELSEAEPAYTTIATVLTNLERKGLVSRERHGRSVLHAPVVSREQHTARTMQAALVDGGDRAASILHFVEGIDAADIRLLRDYLDEKGTAE